MKMLQVLKSFPILDLVVLLIVTAYLAYKPRGAVERYDLLTKGVMTTGQVEKIERLPFGIFLSYTFLTQEGTITTGIAQALDIAEYGITDQLPQKVKVTYLPSDTNTSTIDTEEYQPQTFWKDYIRDYWSTLAAYYLILVILIRVCLNAGKRMIDDGDTPVFQSRP